MDGRTSREVTQPTAPIHITKYITIAPIATLQPSKTLMQDIYERGMDHRKFDNI